ncbi:hypothetical protein FJV46_01060 [Arthrobacter agilis]|uniref:helix-turn-helix transcriptional regulator n=1 Tax=Arthrobacter agilis TaxID=37921 RepID=UPI000B356CD5|nr:LuxR C-terminal-related transcriptional regulator [Arthrobacter agilis]OUM40486.1 hypothetical protein B8W74_13285 [Arthrobacter agilis]PPB45098.1 hypothetical protein CI784_13305 [Arthrobacter agilis]TPV27803.1 hypothetical protein FJV46_01060 [Arthrobacter agilis]VDR31542.1 two component system sensor kinase SsrB [Arthrobacter agilis]
MTTSGTRSALVGRDRLIEDVRAALSDPAGFGAMLVGEAGVGKTAVARAVVGRLHWTAPVLRVTGGSSLRAIPFGALAPYLHTLSVTDADSPVAVLRAVMGHLAAEGSNRPGRLPLIIVEDAHELDDSSTSLLTQLISARRAKALVLIRTSPNVPAEFGTLGADGLLARFDLQPLDTDQVALVCAQVLGGPVLTGTSLALALLTGGNPLFLRTFLEQARSAGQLRSRNGIWRFDGDRSTVHLRMGDLVRARFRSRSSDDHRALELVALAEPIPLSAVTGCVDPATLQALLDERLLAVSPDQDVRLAYPVYGDVLRGQVPAARRITICRRLLEVTDEEPASSEGFLRRVSWGLETGSPPDDLTLLRAAAVANDLRDHDLALRAAGAVSAPGFRGRVLIETARAHMGRGTVDYAHELVDEVLRHCGDLQVARDATRLSFDLKLLSGASTADLRADVARWRSLITELARPDEASPTGQDPAGDQLGCAVLECHVLILEGRYDGVEETLRGVSEAPGAPEETRAASLLLLAELLSSTGRGEEGRSCSAEALDLTDRAGVQLLTLRERAVARHAVILTGLGRTAEAGDVLRSHAQLHPLTMLNFAGWGDVVAGMTALRAAQNRQARDRFVLALEALTDIDTSQVRTLLVGLAAYASARAGDTSRARTLIEEFEHTPQRGSRSMHLGGSIFTTAAASILGDAPAGREDLLRLASVAEKNQMKELAATALKLSLLLGDTNAITPMIRVLAQYEGREAATLLEYLRAAQARNAEGMILAASRAGEDGDVAFEFAGLSLAQQYAGGQSAGRRNRAVQRRLVVLGEQREGPEAQSLTSASSGTGAAQLTPTERAIAALVKEGYSNRDIAEKKNVSVRTVEGHLYRIFAKLGVNRREDLRDS